MTLTTPTPPPQFLYYTLCYLVSSVLDMENTLWCYQKSARKGHTPPPTPPTPTSSILWHLDDIQTGSQSLWRHNKHGGRRAVLRELQFGWIIPRGRSVNVRAAQVKSDVGLSNSRGYVFLLLR